MHTFQQPALNAIPFFAALDAQQKRALEPLCAVEEYAPDAPIFVYGDPGDALYLVAEGQVEVFTHNNARTEITLERVDVGTAFGEVALYNGGTRTANAKAVGPTTLVCIDRAHVPAVLLLCPALTEALLSSMAGRLRVSSDSLRRLTAFDINAMRQQQMTPFDRLCVRVVDVLSSATFLAVIVVVFAWWVIFKPFHDANLDGLALVEGTAGFLITLLVLLGQKREQKTSAVTDAEESLAIRQAARELQYLHEKMDAALSRTASLSDQSPHE